MEIIKNRMIKSEKKLLKENMEIMKDIQKNLIKEGYNYNEIKE